MNEWNESGTPEPFSPETGPESGKSGRRSFLAGALTGALIAAAAALAFILAVYVIPGNGGAKETDAAQESGFESALGKADQKLRSIQKLIDGQFLFEYDEDTLIDSMLKGYVSGLGDAYSEYYTPGEMEDILSTLNGTYYGIGVLVTLDKNGDVLALQVFSGSPAEAAGIQEGDIITEIDGQTVRDHSLDEAVSWIKGEEGTTVDITLLRGSETLTLPVERGEVTVETVTCEMLEDGIGYLQLIQFEEVSLEQFKAALEDLKAQGMEKLIVDLRDNPGGLLDTCVDIAGLFMDGGTVTIVADKNGNETTYSAEKGAAWTGPLVLLVNGNSASASEVLTGCLQDHGRATVIGTQTFGKGIVQTFFPLGDSSVVKLTTDDYFTPQHRNIHGTGITPDLIVEIPEDGETGDGTAAETDVQLEAAVEYLSKP